MNKCIFVTGLHRAGTHSFAEHKAEELSLPYIEEGGIKWDSLDNAISLITKHPDGFACHCPGLAHKSLELVKVGKVYWVTRNKVDTITSMKNAGIGTMAWHIMKGFKEEFPDDEIWTTLTYDGKEDVYFEFINYYKLLIETKEYFYNKYFKSFVSLVRTEDQPYYDFSKTLTSVHPLKDHESLRIR